MDELSRRLQACIAVEKSAAEIYRKLADFFPEEGSFFMELCREEEDHVAILSMGKLYKMISRLPDDIVPHSLPMITETLAIANEIDSRLDDDDLSLKEALKLTLRFEKSVAEEHLQLVMKMEHDDETINKLKRLQVETVTHADKIAALLNQKGLLS
jgi:rubrerythrin